MAPPAPPPAAAPPGAFFRVGGEKIDSLERGGGMGKSEYIPLFGKIGNNLNMSIFYRN